MTRRKYNPKKYKRTEPGDPLTSKWTVRKLLINGKKRDVLIRKRDGVIEKRVIDDKRMSPIISFTEAKKIHRKRSQRAKTIDNSQSNKKTKHFADKSWVKNPGRTDVKGIDTKKRKSNNIKSKKFNIPNKSWKNEEILNYVKKYNAKAKIRQTFYYGSLETNYGLQTNIKTYNNLSQSQKNIIIRELNEEGVFENDTGKTKEYYTNLKYSFKKLPPNSLPMSSWESLDKFIKTFGKERVIHDIKKIHELERSIINKGYNQNYPVILEYIPNHKKSYIGTGNHRIQSVRNLIARKKINRNFKIPVIIVIHDEKLKQKLKSKYKKPQRRNRYRKPQRRIKIKPTR